MVTKKNNTFSTILWQYIQLLTCCDTHGEVLYMQNYFMFLFDIITVLQASSAILAGLGLAAVGFGGRYILRSAPILSNRLNEVLKQIPQMDTEVFCPLNCLYLTYPVYY